MEAHEQAREYLVEVEHKVKFADVLEELVCVGVMLE